MFRSALVLIGLVSISASFQGVSFNTIMHSEQSTGGSGNVMTVIAPCPELFDAPDHSYRCTRRPPLKLTYCCSLGEWLLNDGLFSMVEIIGGISVVVVVILSIFFCQCCSCCPGNRHRGRLAQPMIHQIPAGTLVQQHSVGNLETKPAGCPGYSPQ